MHTCKKRLGPFLLFGFLGQIGHALIIGAIWLAKDSAPGPMTLVSLFTLPAFALLCTIVPILFRAFPIVWEEGYTYDDGFLYVIAGIVGSSVGLTHLSQVIPFHEFVIYGSLAVSMIMLFGVGLDAFLAMSEGRTNGVSMVARLCIIAASAVLPTGGLVYGLVAVGVTLLIAHIFRLFSKLVIVAIRVRHLGVPEPPRG